MRQGKLIVFEGIDGSGKSTQFQKMCARLEKRGTDFKRLVFPQYSEESSALIRMYLKGEFGQDPREVSPYAASTFYAVVRYASYVKVWRDYYQSGGLVMADRYTTSNAIHQAAKLPVSERKEFFEWLGGFEYGLLKLPPPDAVIYMDAPFATAALRIQTRASQMGSERDIHEKDLDYLLKCHECGLDAADFYGWTKIAAHRGAEIREIEEIHDEIFQLMFVGCDNPGAPSA